MDLFKDLVVSLFVLQRLGINQMNCFRRTWGIARGVRWYLRCKDQHCCNMLGKKSFARQLIRRSEYKGEHMVTFTQKKKLWVCHGSRNKCVIYWRKDLC